MDAPLEKPALTSGAADTMGSSDKLFCCKWMRNWIPIVYREELYHILRMTGPLLLSRVLQFLLPFVVTMFCGRLGNDVMAGYGLTSAVDAPLCRSRHNEQTRMKYTAIVFHWTPIMTQTGPDRLPGKQGPQYEFHPWQRPENDDAGENWVHHRVPVAHREEMYHILRMTGPLLLSRILNYLLPFVVTMFCGRLGNDVMAGYGLASATINVTSAATGYGLGLACDTLVSQTFGGKNLLQVGVILQRGIIILMLFCLPCWGLLINAQTILLCLGQDPEVARIAQLYITAFLPAVPAMFLHHLQVSYLQNQGIIFPQMYSAALANLANGVTNYIFLYWLDLGVGGSAAANTLSQIYICVFLFAYIRWKKLHVTTWAGWSAESLQEWGSYMKLAIPSTLMKCFEWWVYEFGGFFAGMLSEDELAAQHAVMMVTFITYMFPLGIQAAACARVGNALGAGDSARAILTSKVSLSLAVTFVLAEGLVLGSTKTVIGFIFTSDERIISLVSHLMNAYCFLQFFDGLVCVCTGIFLGAGKQKIPAIANFIGYYCIGLSLSVTLMFVAKLRVLGFWMGLLVCVILQSTFYIIVIFRLNWEKVTEEAVKRAHMSDSEGTAEQASCNEKPVDGYMSVCTDCHDGNTEREGGHMVQQPRGNRLSTSQLIIRRGLIMFAAVALLAVGAMVHFLVPLPVIHSTESNLTMNWINASFTTDTIFITELVPNEESA